jgi:thiol-disulfide isomerase/thioredoxin
LIARLLSAAALALASAGSAVGQQPDHPPVAAAPVQTNFFPADADGAAVLDAALVHGRDSGKISLIVFGADWCHDSRALARALESAAFKAEFADRFSIALIDVGRPQTGNGRNLDLVARLGVKNLKSTPALFAISPKGKRINSKKDAIGWRNADSRGEAAILEWFRKIAARDS